MSQHRIKQPVAKKRYRQPPERTNSYYPGKYSYVSTIWGLWWHGNGAYFRNKLTGINAQRGVT